MRKIGIISFVLGVFLLLQGCGKIGENLNKEEKPVDGNISEHSPLVTDETFSSINSVGITEDGVFEYKIEANKAEIVSVLKDSLQITVPNEINGCPVTSIGDSAFYQKTECKSIILPQTLQKIKKAAFYRCYSLEEIVIPENVSFVACDAFFRTNNLCKIIVDTKNEWYCDVDGVLFDKSKNVLVCYPEGRADEEYNIPDSVKKIESAAFGYSPEVDRVVVLNDTVSFPQELFVVSTENLTIVARQDSTAEKYAKKWEIPFEKYGD